MWSAHHGRDLFEDLKHIRNAIDLDASRRIPETTDQTVTILAKANRLIRPHRRPNTSSKDPQLELF